MVKRFKPRERSQRTMKIYSGPFLTPEGFVQARVNVEYDSLCGMGTVVDFEEGGDRGIPCMIVPTLYNAHVHTGDSVVKEVPSGTIEEIVGPGGFKHRALESASREEITTSVRDYLREAMENGILDIVDFREGGVEGVEIMRDALEGMECQPRVRIMSRPRRNRFDPEEISALLSMSHGMGLSAFRDWDPSTLEQVAEEVHKAGKPLAMHCSEAVREPLDRLLDLHVHHLVHMVEASPEDLAECAGEGIPVVVCPRSNMFFGKAPDIPGMLEAGLTLCLGTDNAMISSPDMFGEMKAAYTISKNGADPLRILLMATWNPRKALNLTWSIGSSKSRVDSRERYLILEPPEGDPAAHAVIRTGPENVIEIVEW